MFGKDPKAVTRLVSHVSLVSQGCCAASTHVNNIPIANVSVFSALITFLSLLPNYDWWIVVRF